jgi:hypothetical protein
VKTRGVIKTAVVLGAISVLIPLLVIYLLTLIGLVFGYGQDVTTLLWILFTIPFGFLYYFLILPRIKISGLKINKKKDWEALGIVLTLTFTIIATLLSIQSFYGQTITQSRCFNPSNVTVTSPNCKVIQTVSVPQAGIVGSYGILALDSVLLGLAAFGVWLAILYALSKSEIGKTE